MAHGCGNAMPHGQRIILIEFPRLVYKKMNSRNLRSTSSKRVKNVTKISTKYLILLTNPSRSDWASDARINLYQIQIPVVTNV